MIRATISLCLSFGFFSGCQLSEGNDIPTTTANSENSMTNDSEINIKLSGNHTTSQVQIISNSGPAASYDLQLSLSNTANFRTSNRYDFNLNTQYTTAAEYSSILEMPREQLSH